MAFDVKGNHNRSLLTFFGGGCAFFVVLTFLCTLAVKVVKALRCAQYFDGFPRNLSTKFLYLYKRTKIECKK